MNRSVSGRRERPSHEPWSCPIDELDRSFFALIAAVLNFEAKDADLAARFYLYVQRSSVFIVSNV
jgi:hypothetical protein